MTAWSPAQESTDQKGQKGAKGQNKEEQRQGEGQARPPEEGYTRRAPQIEGRVPQEIGLLRKLLRSLSVSDIHLN